MNEPYDSRKNVLRHKEKVSYWLLEKANRITERAKIHDDSKLEEPEKSMFDEWIPNLQRVEFGSDEYKAALQGMGEGLREHYKNNRHHPEHYENGINGMTLVDIIEMVCDWMAAAQEKRQYVNLDYLAERFGISEQLVEIIVNTLREDDLWNEVEGVPAPYFCPPDRRDGHIEGFERKNR